MAVFTDGGVRKGFRKTAAGWVAVAVVESMPCWLAEGGVEVAFNLRLSSFEMETVGIDEAIAKIRPLKSQETDMNNLPANKVAFMWAREEVVTRRLRGG